MAISFDTLPEAVRAILEQVQTINHKIDSLPLIAQEQPDENRFVGIDEIRQTIFPQWKKQTIYNKCSLGELPHSRIGSRLLFNLKECREWRDSQLVVNCFQKHTCILPENKRNQKRINNYISER